jgi:hypothetical protein
MHGGAGSSYDREPYAFTSSSKVEVIPATLKALALTIAGTIVGRARRRTVGQRRRRQVEAHDQDPVGPG